MKTYEKDDLPSFFSSAFREVSPSNPLSSVDVSFSNTRTNPIILSHFTSNLRKSRTVNELFEQIMQTIADFSSLNVYKSINVRLSPGETMNKAEILLDFKEKSRIFANFSHYFQTRSSEATLSCKAGVRNLLGFTEKFTLEYEKALNNSKRSEFDFSLELPFLVFFKDFRDFLRKPNKTQGNHRDFLVNNTKILRDVSIVAGHSEGHKFLTKNIEEQFELTFLRVLLGGSQSSWTFSSNLRTNFLENKHVCAEFLENELLPSRKYAIKYQKTLQNTLHDTKTHKPKGKFADFALEFAFGDVLLAKCEFLRRQHFRIPQLKRVFPKKIAKSLRFEHDFSLKTVQSLRPSVALRVNDREDAQNSRGFGEIGPKAPPFNEIQHPFAGKPGYEHVGDLLGSDFVAKTALKVGLFEFPALKSGNIVPFAHVSAAWIRDFPRKTKENRGIWSDFARNLRVSAGIGAFARVAADTRLEILYNFAHFRSRGDVPCEFQIRLSMND